MTSNNTFAAVNTPAVDLNGIDPVAFSGLCRTVEKYASSPQARPHRYLHAAVRRLSIFANDDEMDVHAPDRVARALQLYGPLLNARQVDAVRDWLWGQQ